MAHVGAFGASLHHITYCKQINIKIHGSQAVCLNFYFLNNAS